MFNAVCHNVKCHSAMGVIMECYFAEFHYVKCHSVEHWLSAVMLSAILSLLRVSLC